MTVKPEDLDLLCCPDCQGPLRVGERGVGGRSAVIETGELRCDPCSASWPVVRGVPRFVGEARDVASFAHQWRVHARTQYDSHTGLPISERRFFETTRWPRRMEGARVLEVGCGAGRFTEQAALTGATLVSVDLSAAVETNVEQNGHQPNVLIVQADLHRMPLPRAGFDRVFCLGVLQHCPDPRRAFHRLAYHLRPGGWIAVDCYDRGLFHFYLHTKYWVRPFLLHMDPVRLHGLVRRYVDLLWPVASVLRRIPWIGVPLNWRLLVADHSRSGLSGEALKEWAYLDTFDMLASRHDHPHTVSQVRSWFVEAGLDAVEVQRGHNGIEGRGRRPPTTGAKTPSSGDSG